MSSSHNFFFSQLSLLLLLLHTANTVVVIDHVIQFFQRTLNRILFRPIFCITRRGSALTSIAPSLPPSRRWPSRGSSSRCTVRSGITICCKSCGTFGITWSFSSYRAVGRTSRPRRHDIADGHRQMKSKMILFPFASRAIEVLNRIRCPVLRKSFQSSFPISI